MDQPLFTQVINYSDRAFNRVLVTLTADDNDDHQNHVIVTINFNAFVSGTYLVQLKFLGFRIRDDGVKLQALQASAEEMAKWLVLNGSYKSYPEVELQEYKQIIVAHRRSDKADYYYEYRESDHTLLIDHPPLATLAVLESKLARQLIIHYLYDKNYILPVSLMHQVNFPEEVLDRELDGLLLSRYLGKAGDTVVLSTEGREYYESGFGSNIGTVFIIAACSPPPAEASFKEQHDAVLSVYKRAVDDAGYRPIFQEHEEPRKNIYVDVFDYLDTCEFVVADVTWERPNCYVEIGYALAARKQVLLFVEESYLSRMERQQMPFDLAPIKYLSYRRDVEGQKELRRQIDQRITVVKQRRLADG